MSGDAERKRRAHKLLTTRHDRTRCWTHKAYFADEDEIGAWLREYNRHHDPAHRLRAYRCLICLGWHATKANPRGRKRSGRRTGRAK